MAKHKIRLRKQEAGKEGYQGLFGASCRKGLAWYKQNKEALGVLGNLFRPVELFIQLVN
jgi:hypothetical protein